MTTGETTADARILLLCRTTEPPLAEHRSIAGRRPLVVVEGDEGYAAVLAELDGAGWRVAASGPAGTGLACTVHTVRSRPDAEVALVAAVRGCGVIVRVAPDPDLGEIVADLVEDLAGLGPVLYIDTATVVDLDGDTWRLVHALARGTTLDSAARSLHLSTRTANRRVAAACGAIGVDSRAQLIRALASSARIPPALNSD